jgi:hypothetical protein
MDSATLSLEKEADWYESDSEGEGSVAVGTPCDIKVTPMASSQGESHHGALVSPSSPAVLEPALPIIPSSQAVPGPGPVLPIIEIIRSPAELEVTTPAGVPPGVPPPLTSVSGSSSKFLLVPVPVEDESDSEDGGITPLSLPPPKPTKGKIWVPQNDKKKPKVSENVIRVSVLDSYPNLYLHLANYSNWLTGATVLPVQDQAPLQPDSGALHV